MSFDGNTYKSGNKFFMREQYSKDTTYLFMKFGTNVIFTHISENSGIQIIVEELVADMVK